MSVHQITLYFVTPLRRIQHEFEFTYDQCLPRWLNVLGVNAFNYFLQFDLDLDLVIRTYFFFQARYPEMFLLQLVWDPSYKAPSLAARDSTKPDGWTWVITCHFVELFIRGISKPLTMGVSSSPHTKGEIKAQSYSGAQEKHPGLPRLPFSALSTVFTADLNLSCVIPPFSLQSREVLRRGEWCLIFFISIIKHIADLTL